MFGLKSHKYIFFNLGIAKNNFESKMKLKKYSCGLFKEQTPTLRLLGIL